MTDLELAKKEMRELLPPGSKVDAEARHRSKSGMTHDIALFKTSCTSDERTDITGRVAEILERPMKNNGIRVGGAGLDKGVHLRMELSKELYGSAYCLDGYENDEVKKVKAELSKKELKNSVDGLKTAWKPSDCKTDDATEKQEERHTRQRKM